jgi:threonine dehydratase
MHAPEKTVETTGPTFTDILKAKRTLSRYLARTPLINYPGLDKLCGARILVKHENHQMTGAFKVRGGINLIAQLPDDERRRGVISASTGNHGQSIAYAARLWRTGGHRSSGKRQSTQGRRDGSVGGRGGVSRVRL